MQRWLSANLIVWVRLILCISVFWDHIRFVYALQDVCVVQTLCRSHVFYTHFVFCPNLLLFIALKCNSNEGGMDACKAGGVTVPPYKWAGFTGI